MARRKRTLHMILGVFIGVLIGHLIKYHRETTTNVCNHVGKVMRKTYADVGNTWPESRKMTSLKETVNYTSNENNPDKTLLFVGVMTAAKYLETRAKAVYKTWGSELPGKIAFFSSGVSHSDTVPLVALPGVDDSYPPQKKSFMMLKYMYDHYGDQFEWFLRADDDVYIRTDKLEMFLRSIDSRKAQFIGQAGRGNNEEFGLLSLEYDENFCMGGPGVILSRETLKRIAPHISYCLDNLYTTHEDVELGRCVKKFAGIPCTWSYDMQSILYHNQSGDAAFTGKLKQREVHRAITLHPVKQPEHLYRLHNYFRELKIQALKQESIILHRELLTCRKSTEDDTFMDNFMPQSVQKGSPDYLGDTNVIGIAPGLNRFQPDNLEDVLIWSFISKSLYSMEESNPRRKLDTALREGIEDVVREVMENINMYSKQRGRVIEFREVLYGYKRLNPLHGVDWVLDLLLVYKKYRGHKMTVPVRRHAYVQQSFTGLEIQELPLNEDTQRNYVNMESEQFNIGHKLHRVFYDGIQHIKSLKILPSLLGSDDMTNNGNPIQNKKINFILPLSGRFTTFQRFIKYYEEVCVRNQEKVSLTIVLYFNSDAPDDYDKSIDLLDNFKKKYSHANIIVIPVLNRAFSRGEALHIGTLKSDEADLLFLIDVDMVFTSQTLLRVRTNTIKNKQVYFPIVFSEYDHRFVSLGEHLKLNLTEYDINRFDELFLRTIDVSSAKSNFLLKSSAANKFIRNKNYLDNDLDVRYDFTIDDNSGYWRQFGYGIVSLYKSDLMQVGGFNTTIQGWGLEDVSLFNNFLKSNIKIFRAPDPSLVHVFHSIECSVDLSLAQRDMCFGSRANTLGSWRTLFEFVKRNSKVLNYIKMLKNNKPGS